MKSVPFKLIVVCCALLGSVCYGDGPVDNIPPEEPKGMIPMAAESITFPFDPTAYSFLIYNTHGSESSIKQAMDKWGLSYTERDSNVGNHVTLADLQNHDILIVGWNAGGNTSGLNPNVLANGITGRIIISGHDADYHTVNGPTGAEKFLIQAIDYVLSFGGTGMITLGDSTSPAFDYLPTDWGITPTNNGGETVSSFTTEGLASGVYDGLIPNDPSGNADIRMSPWGTAYHNTFDAWNYAFVPFERDDSNRVVTIAAPINPVGFDFTKVATDPNCRGLGEEITYSICWNNITTQTFTDVNIVDVLPVDVIFNSANSPGIYDSNTHTYLWEGLGTLYPDDSGCVELTVTVNDIAAPCIILHNQADLWGTVIVYDPNGIGHPVTKLIAVATEDTPVCCWDQIDPDIIYVDWMATGNDNGTDWEHAYSGQDGLQSALYRATMADPNCCAGSYKIYVAQGPYKPGDNVDDSFILPENVSLYGGFPSGGCAFNLRNPERYETVLSGQIDEYTRADRIVTMGHNSLLDGFIVTGAADYGIYGYGMDFTIENCTIIDNDNYGIRGQNGNVMVKWCELNNNKGYAIRHDGAGSTLTVENCGIMKNQRYGIYCQDSTPTVRNSIISESDLAKEASAGIRLINPADSPILHNNTIAHNRDVGISFVGSNLPDIQNCIVYYNNGGGLQLSKSLNPDAVAQYSCIADCNEVNGNINREPEFAYIDPNSSLPDPNNMHILYMSPCKDAGNPYPFYERQVDMDKQPRVVDVVDIGAYEVRCGQDPNDVANELDWNTDGLVNLDEFSKFQKAWLNYDPNGPGPQDPNENWNPLCDLDGDHQITLSDIVLFIDDAPWLWEACWKDSADCFDSVNVLDYNTDGLVNMVEFSLFAENWLKYSPTDPEWQFCNLDNTGDSEDTIDLADLMIFLDEWLWVSCTIADQFPEPDPPVQSQSQSYEPTALDEALQLHDTTCSMNEIWQTDPNIQQEVDPNDWYEMMDSVCLELDALLATLTENELMAYNLIAGEDCCGGEEMMMSGSGDEMMMSTESLSMETTYIESESALVETKWEESPYAEMSTSELSSLAVGIYSVLDSVDSALVEGHENAENLLEIEDFLENVLLDIEASRQ